MRRTIIFLCLLFVEQVVLDPYLVGNFPLNAVDEAHDADSSQRELPTFQFNYDPKGIFQNTNGFMDYKVCGQLFPTSRICDLMFGSCKSCSLVIKRCSRTGDRNFDCKKRSDYLNTSEDIHFENETGYDLSTFENIHSEEEAGNGLSSSKEPNVTMKTIPAEEEPSHQKDPSVRFKRSQRKVNNKKFAKKDKCPKLPKFENSYYDCKKKNSTKRCVIQCIFPHIHFNGRRRNTIQCDMTDKKPVWKPKGFGDCFHLFPYERLEDIRYKGRKHPIPDYIIDKEDRDYYKPKPYKNFYLALFG